MDAPTDDHNLRIAPMPTDSEESEAIEHDEWRSLFRAGQSVPTFPESSSEPQPLRLERFERETETHEPEIAQLIVELGRGRITPQAVAEETILLLDRRGDSPLDILHNGRVIARGIPLIVRGKIALKIVERLEV